MRKLLISSLLMISTSFSSGEVIEKSFSKELNWTNTVNQITLGSIHMSFISAKNNTVSFSINKGKYNYLLYRATSASQTSAGYISDGGPIILKAGDVITISNSVSDACLGRICLYEVKQ